MHLKVLFLAILFTSQTLFAANSQTKTKRPFMTLAKTKKIIKQLKRDRKKRKIASLSGTAVPTEEGMSEKLIEFRDSFLATTDPLILDKKLKGLEEIADGDFAKLPIDYQFVAAQAVMLRSFRSLIYRMSKPGMWEQANFSHSYALGMVKELASTTRTFFGMGDTLDDKGPGRVVFDYIAYPQLEEKKGEKRQQRKARIEGIKESRFSSMKEVQNWMCNDLYSRLDKATGRIQKIYDSWEKNKAGAIVWDNQFYSRKAVSEENGDNLKRFQFVQEAEVAMLLSGMESGLANLNMSCAYNLEKFMAFNQAIGSLMGKDGLKSRLPKGLLDYGISSHHRVEVLRERKYANFLKKKPGGDRRMKEALYNLRASINYAMLSFEHTLSSVQNPYFMIERDKVMPFQKEIERNLLRATTLVFDRESTIKGAINRGETIKVKLVNFFEKPPADIKKFYPPKMPKGGKKKRKMLSEWYDNSDYWYDKSLKSRNYYRGRIIKWNVGALSPYLPEVARLKDEDVPSYISKAIRVASQGWGYGLVSGPLGAIAK